jgi:hypothetical protein
VKITVRHRLEGFARIAKRAIAKSVVVVMLVRGIASKRTTRISAPALSMDTARASTLACGDGVDVVVAFGSCEPVEIHGGVCGYKDEAGVRHPLF